MRRRRGIRGCVSTVAFGRCVASQAKGHDRDDCKGFFHKHDLTNETILPCFGCALLPRFSESLLEAADVGYEGFDLVVAQRAAERNHPGDTVFGHAIFNRRRRLSVGKR